MMRRFGRLILFVAAFSLALSPAAWAAGKVGYFEMQRVLSESKWGKKSADDFKRQQDVIKADVEAKGKAFKTAREEFDKKKDVMDDKAKAKKIKELTDMQAEGEKLLNDANQKMTKLSQDLRGPLVDKIIEIVRKIGRDEKYDMIFERETAGLVHANEKDDLTKQVIDEVDKSGPKK
jgi:outer membrane protein